MRIWSTNGFAFLACGGTPKIYLSSAPPLPIPRFRQRPTHMREHLLGEAGPLALVKRSIEADEPAAAPEAVPGHLELVHRVHVLDVQLEGGPVRRLRRPEVQVLVPPRLEVERVVAVV